MTFCGRPFAFWRETYYELNSNGRLNWRPMTRPTENTRGSIIKAAVRLFAEKGLQGASVRDIVVKARVNQAAINYHFKGKGAGGGHCRRVGVAFLLSRLGLAERNNAEREREPHFAFPGSSGHCLGHTRSTSVTVCSSPRSLALRFWKLPLASRREPLPCNDDLVRAPFGPPQPQDASRIPPSDCGVSAQPHCSCDARSSSLRV
jgi:hypothetical protein